jgi:hypothetical protein
MSDYVPTISNLLHLSTAHLSPEVRLNPNQYPGVIADEREYGWLLFVPEDIDGHVAAYRDEDPEHPIPAEIVFIWCYAERHDCQYVLLDRYEAENPDLQRFQWII